jgi:hypothetical protein
MTPKVRAQLRAEREAVVEVQVANTPTFEAFVDGEPVSISVMFYHYQQDPFPGGKRYRVVMNDREWARIFRENAFAGTSGKPSEKDQNSILGLFFDAVSMHLKENFAKDVRYFANDVGLLEVTEERVVLEGTCSDRVRRGSTT